MRAGRKLEKPKALDAKSGSKLGRAAASLGQWAIQGEGGRGNSENC